MKKLLLLLALLFPIGAFGQPILRNSFTTNAPAKAPKLMTTTSGTLYPLMVTSNNVAADQTIHFSSGFYMSNNIGHFENWILLSGQTNQISDSGTQLLYNGNPIGGGGGITNSGVGTNNYLAKWTGTNSLGSSIILEDVSINPELHFPFNISLYSSNQAGDNIIRMLANNAADEVWVGDSGSALYLNGNTNFAQNRLLFDVNNSSVHLDFRDTAATPPATSGHIRVHNGFTMTGWTGSNNRNIIRSGATGIKFGDSSINTLIDGSPVSISDLATERLIYNDVSGNLSTIANAAGVLTNDGAGGLGWSTDIGSASNPINNFYSTNNFFISGKGNTLVITQTLTVSGQYVYPLVPGTGITFTTNNIGTGQTNLTISATATSETTGTNIVTLTQTTTNVSAMDFSLVQRGGVFKLVMTGNAYIGAPTGVANTSVSQCWLMVQQPSTGTCVLTFTNLYCFSEGVMPIIDTNNSAVSVFQLVSDVFTNGLVHASVSTPSKRTP